MKPYENIVGKGENAGNHNVFYLSRNKFQLLDHIKFVVCKCFPKLICDVIYLFPTQGK